MDQFERNVKEIAEQRDAPLRAAQAELRPIRGELVKGLEAHRRLAAATLSLRVAAAWAKFNAAAAAFGYMPSANLYEALGKYEELRGGGEGLYLAMIARIDQLGARTVYERGHIDLYNAPANCRPANGLESRVKAIESNVKEMEEAIEYKRREGAPAPVEIAIKRPTDRPAEIPVLTDFDPRL